MSEGDAVTIQRITTLEKITDNHIANAVTKELHAAEYQSLERRIAGVEGQLKHLTFFMLTNLVTLVGFLAWQIVSKIG